jgi:hypothetical protein
MDSCHWAPYYKAVFERNPVTLAVFSEKELMEIYQELQSWPGESIYDGNRLALPDETVNYRRGDGIEKALTLWHIARSRRIPCSVAQHGQSITLKAGAGHFTFETAKELTLPDPGRLQ